MISNLKKIYNIVLDKELTLNAASLSFFTIFSLVPLLLVMMSILTYLDSFKSIYLEIQDIIFKNFLPVNHEIVMGYIDDFLAHSTQMGMLGFVVLFISSLLFFQDYEYVANKIFRAKQRAFLQSFGIYILLILITPVSLGMAFYITAYIASAMASHSLTSDINILPVLPYLIIWLLFTILFKLSANMKVTFKAAMLSSLAVTIVFSIAKNMFIYYVFLNQSYSIIYDSLSILMFLFLWIYISWFIYLHGLQLCRYLNEKEL